MEFAKDQVSFEQFQKMLRDPKLRPLIGLDVDDATVASVLNDADIASLYYQTWRTGPVGPAPSQIVPPLRPQAAPSLPADSPHGAEMRGIALIEAIIGLGLTCTVFVLRPIFGALLFPYGMDSAAVTAFSVVSVLTALVALGFSIASVWNASRLGPGRFRTPTLVIGIIAITVAGVVVLGWLGRFLLSL